MDGILGLTTAYEMLNIFFLLPVTRWTITEVTRRKKKNLVQQIQGKTQNAKFAHFFILVSDLDSGIFSVSDLDNNSLWFGQWIFGCTNQSYVLSITDGPCQEYQRVPDGLGHNALCCTRLPCAFWHTWVRATKHQIFFCLFHTIRGSLKTVSRQQEKEQK